MAITGGSISTTSSPALSSASSAQLCTVPAGVGTLVLSNNSGAVVYYAFGSAATTTDGVAIASGGPPIVIQCYPGSKSVVVNVIAATAPTASAPVSWLFSSGQ